MGHVQGAEAVSEEPVDSAPGVLYPEWVRECERPPLDEEAKLDRGGKTCMLVPTDVELTPGDELPRWELRSPSPSASSSER